MIVAASVVPAHAQDADPSRPFGLVPCTGIDPDDDFTGPPAPNQHRCTFADLVRLGQNIINWLLYIAVFLAAVLLGWAGVLYMSAGGDESRVKLAHEIFKNVLIGFIIALAAWLIVYTITTALLKPDSDIQLLENPGP